METKTGARALGACLSITRILLAKEGRITQTYSSFPAFDRVRLLTEFVRGWRVERPGASCPYAASSNGGHAMGGILARSSWLEAALIAICLACAPALAQAPITSMARTAAERAIDGKERN